MKNKFMTAVVAGTLVFSVACNKAKKNDSSAGQVQSLDPNQGDWKVQEVSGNDDAQGVFMQGAHIAIEDRDGNLVLVRGNSEFSFEKGITDCGGNEFDGFRLGDSTFAAVEKIEKTLDGETMTIKVFSSGKTSCGLLDDYSTSEVKLIRLKLDPATGLPEESKKAEKPADTSEESCTEDGQC